MFLRELLRKVLRTGCSGVQVPRELIDPRRKEAQESREWIRTLVDDHVRMTLVLYSGQIVIERF